MRGDFRATEPPNRNGCATTLCTQMRMPRKSFRLRQFAAPTGARKGRDPARRTQCRVRHFRKRPGEIRGCGV